MFSKGSCLPPRILFISGIVGDDGSNECGVLADVLEGKEQMLGTLE